MAFTIVPTFAHDAVIQMFQLTTFVLALLLTLRHNRTCEPMGGTWVAERRR